MCLHVRHCKKASQEGASWATDDMKDATKAIKNEIDAKELSCVVHCYVVPFIVMNNFCDGLLSSICK